MITHDVEEAIFLSQRIYVLTSGPGTVKKEIQIDLSSDSTGEMVRDRTYQIKRHPKFQAYKDEVLQLLSTDSDESQSQTSLQELPLIV
ncbi:MAG TPA: hypothetical protein V6D12_17720 [Candidatus Obscuribacterales bacterium]